MRDIVFGMRINETERQLFIAAAKVRGIGLSAHVRDLAAEGSRNWLEATDESRSEEDRGV